MVHEFQNLIDSLPARQKANSKWIRTKISPCAILIKCCHCGEYLTPDNFSKSNSEGSRRTSLGTRLKGYCRVCDNKRFLRTDHRKKLLHSAKQRAKEKGLPFDLTADDIVIPNECPALGILLVPSVGEGRKTLTKLNSSPSVDRVDNSKGYTKDNICVISLRANNVKKDATLEELRSLVAHMESVVRLPVKDMSGELMIEARQIAERRMTDRIALGCFAETNNNTLTCRRCKQNLSVDRFSFVNCVYKGRKAYDGTWRNSYCKECAVDMFLIRDPRYKLLDAARRRSKMFGLEFNIKKEDVPIPEFCPVLGIKLKPTVGEGRKHISLLDASPSIDRIDSSRGYTRDNVQVISFRANNLKKDATLEELKALVRYVETFHAEAQK